MTSRATQPTKIRIVLDVSCAGSVSPAETVHVSVKNRIRSALNKEFQLVRLGPTISLEAIRTHQAAVCSPNKIEALLRTRIEDGDLSVEDIPSRLTRYGMMDPDEFVSEMRERMDMAESAEAEGRSDAGPGATECS